jgi:hypothetical protein
VLASRGRARQARMPSQALRPVPGRRTPAGESAPADVELAGRIRWRRRQLAAVIREDVAEAIRVLEEESATRSSSPPAWPRGRLASIACATGRRRGRRVRTWRSPGRASHGDQRRADVVILPPETWVAVRDRVAELLDAAEVDGVAAQSTGLTAAGSNEFGPDVGGRQCEGLVPPSARGARAPQSGHGRAQRVLNVCVCPCR